MARYLVLRSNASITLKFGIPHTKSIYKIDVSAGRFKSIFPNLFDKAVITVTYEITNYENTWGLVEILINASESH